METLPIVFLLDGDNNGRDSTATYLESFGLAVESFASSASLLDSIKPDVPGCFVLKLELPETNGLELRQRLVEKGCAQPFIVLSDRGNVALAVEAIRLGAIDVIEKPFEFARLLAAIRRAIALDAVERSRLSEQRGRAS